MPPLEFIDNNVVTAPKIRPGRAKSHEVGLSIADLFACAKSHGIPTSPELQKTLIAYPEICNADLRGAARIAVRKAQLSMAVV
jgi:hypothetical protein